MEIRLLGELEAVDDAGERVDVRGTKQRTLLAALAVSRGEPVSIDRLVDVVWGDDVPGNPANAVQAQVSQLRRMLGAQTIVTRQGGYALVAELDTERLERRVDDGRDRLASGDVDGAAAMLRDAITMCTSDPLAEFAFADFAAGERARLHELRLLTLEAYADSELALGHHRELTGRLEASARSTRCGNACGHSS